MFHVEVYLFVQYQYMYIYIYQLSSAHRKGITCVFLFCILIKTCFMLKYIYLYNKNTLNILSVFKKISVYVYIYINSVLLNFSKHMRYEKYVLSEIHSHNSFFYTCLKGITWVFKYF